MALAAFSWAPLTASWPVRKGVELPVPAFTAPAQSPAPFPDTAVMGTEQALYPLIGRRIEAGLIHHSSDSFTTSVW